MVLIKMEKNKNQWKLKFNFKFKNLSITDILKQTKEEWKLEVIS